MAKPKFIHLVEDEKEASHFMWLYNALPRRQKVKWRKAMHRAIKSRNAGE